MIHFGHQLISNFVCLLYGAGKGLWGFKAAPLNNFDESANTESNSKIKSKKKYYIIK